jgi:hypothetical protein
LESKEVGIKNPNFGIGGSRSMKLGGYFFSSTDDATKVAYDTRTIF